MILVICCAGEVDCRPLGFRFEACTVCLVAIFQRSLGLGLRGHAKYSASDICYPWHGSFGDSVLPDARE